MSLVGLALSTHAAFGAGQDLAVLRSYEAPGDCPPATAFMDHFASRTQRVRIVSSSAAAHLSLVVTLTHEDGQVIGKLAMRGRDGVTSHRVVSAQSCDEVVPALAFVAALVADPSAQPAPAPAPSAPILRPNASTQAEPSASILRPNASGQAGANAPTSPGAPAAQAPSPGSQAPSPASQAPSPTSQAASPGSQAPSPASRMADPTVTAPHQTKPAQSAKLSTLGAEYEARWRSSLRIQLGGISGPLPKWSPLGALSLDVEVPQSIWRMRGSFSFGVSGALPSTQDAPPGSVKFHWLAAVTGICPARIALSDQWSTAPCVVGELGMLRGTASGISVPGARTRWWRALGASIQVRWKPEARYFVQSELAVTAPLARDEFGIVNDGQFISVHQVPSMVGRFGLSAGIFL